MKNMNIFSIFDKMLENFFPPERFDELEEDTTGDRKKNLENRLKKVRYRHERITRLNKGYLALGILFIIGSTILYFFKRDVGLVGASLIYAFLFCECQNFWC